MPLDRTKLLRDRIDRVFALAESCDDEEIQAELACFAAVLTSGLIEASCRHFLYKYAEKRAAPQVHKFVEAKLYFFQNAKASQIEDLLALFDDSLVEQFKEQITEQETAAIDSVVNNKNNLAHGQNPGLGLETMKQYHRQVILALEKLEKLCR